MSAVLADDELLISRRFDAPASLIFAMWTNPAHLMHWMGPQGFDCTAAEIDLRVGGTYRMRIRSPEHGDNAFGGVYREIVPNRRLVFTFAWDNTGPSAGLETLITIILTERDAKTTMTFHQTPFRDVDARDRHVGGWTSSFEKAAAYAAGITKAGITREIQR